jgi:hypothetical protein
VSTGDAAGGVVDGRDVGMRFLMWRDVEVDAEVSRDVSVGVVV